MNLINLSGNCEWCFWNIAYVRGNECGNQSIKLSYQKVTLITSNNMVELPVNSSWPLATYLVLVSSNENIDNKKLIFRR